MAVRTLALVLALALALLLSGCASYRDFQSGAEMRDQRTEGEERLWAASERLRDALTRNGQRLDDPAVNAYLNSVLHGLYPEFAGELRVSALDAPYLNAFALPNGDIYITLGMLLAMDNEAQLATVLAHEAVHVLHRHSAEQRSFTQRAAGLLFTVNLLGVTEPIFTELIAVSSMAGYSRDHERDADVGGYDRLLDRGYDVRESSRVFRRLQDEVDASDAELPPFFFSSHPRLQERIDTFDRLAEQQLSTAARQRNADTFRQRLAGPRERALQMKLQGGRYAELIVLLAPDNRPGGLPAWVDFYLAEALRKRADENDPAAAAAAYARAIQAAPDYAASYRGLGLLQMAQGQKAAARRSFQRYLEKAPDAEDAGYVRLYIEELSP